MPPSSRCEWPSIRPGTSTWSAKRRSSFAAPQPSRSAARPTPRMRPSRTATCVALGCIGFMVMMRRAAKTVVAASVMAARPGSGFQARPSSRMHETAAGPRSCLALHRTARPAADRDRRPGRRTTSSACRRSAAAELVAELGLEPVADLLPDLFGLERPEPVDRLLAHDEAHHQQVAQLLERHRVVGAADRCVVVQHRFDHAGVEQPHLADRRVAHDLGHDALDLVAPELVSDLVAHVLLQNRHAADGYSTLLQPGPGSNAASLATVASVFGPRSRS